jgi:hypothetical protein
MLFHDGVVWGSWFGGSARHGAYATTLNLKAATRGLQQTIRTSKCTRLTLAGLGHRYVREYVLCIPKRSTMERYWEYHD